MQLLPRADVNNGPLNDDWSLLMLNIWILSFVALVQFEGNFLEAQLSISLIFIICLIQDDIDKWAFYQQNKYNTGDWMNEI